MAKNESKLQTFKVAAILCLVCSIFVSTAAVLLRDRQNKNKDLDRQKNILIAAGLFDEQTGELITNGRFDADTPFEDLFQKDEKNPRPWIEKATVDLETGKPIDNAVKKQIKDKFPNGYDQRKASRDPDANWSSPLPSEKDIAGIKRRERYADVYYVYKANGDLDQIVLPVRGYGLWSTLWGFLSLDADLVTVRGITFYEHGETPGLGGEVDNPDWKNSWKGKQAFGPQGKVKIRVIKGKVRGSASDAVHRIDGISGATITCRGVTNMMIFWLGPDGFGPFLQQQRKNR
ncbi:MAG: Na(+)-translocating NADH-quinone reductase subunit C [Planctomycetes bacterium]|nr:Na(+)-translocating NADH-quinone reductase subunit C [Planctomycetota bacterium]